MYSFASILCCLTVPIATASSTVTFWVQPNITTGVAAGQKVTVDIYINASEGSAIVGWEVNIKVNPDVLMPGNRTLPLPWVWAESGKAGYFLYDWCKSGGRNYNTTFEAGTRNVTAGTMTDVLEAVVGWRNFTQGTGASGMNKKLVRLYFTSKSATAYSPILITEAYYYTSLNAPADDQRVPNIINGHYNNPVHDVAVKSITPSAPSVYRGGMVTLSVKAFNPGAYNETFTVTAYYNKTASIWQPIRSTNFTLTPLETQTKDFWPVWDTEDVEPGNYTLKANATLAGDINLANNVATTTIEIEQPLHDVAVTAISAPSTATVGDIVPINVTVANLGTETVNFTVTVSYDGEIDVENVTKVTKDETRDLTVQWNTAGVTPNTYNITASAVLWAVTGWVDRVEGNNINTTSITITPGVGGDAAVLSVAPWFKGQVLSAAYRAWTVQVKVTVKNNGAVTISCTVNAYCFNATATHLIGTQPVNDLPAGQNATVTFNWNIADLTANTIYTLKANVTIIGLSDSNTANNQLIYGQVKVRLWGDVDDNGAINILDLKKVKLALSLLIVEPFADLDGDCDVDILDLKKDKLILSGLLSPYSR